MSWTLSCRWISLICWQVTWCTVSPIFGNRHKGQVWKVLAGNRYLKKVIRHNAMSTTEMDHPPFAVEGLLHSWGCTPVRMWTILFRCGGRDLRLGLSQIDGSQHFWSIKVSYCQPAKDPDTCTIPTCQTVVPVARKGVRWSLKSSHPHIPFRTHAVYWRASDMLPVSQLAIDMTGTRRQVQRASIGAIGLCCW